MPSNRLQWRCLRICVHCFNPSNGFVCLRTTNQAMVEEVLNLFQSVERICVPSNAVVMLVFTLLGFVFQSVERICVPSNCPRSVPLLAMTMFQSVERICVPSNSGFAQSVGSSIGGFQSVERICVPSNKERRTPPKGDA